MSLHRSRFALLFLPSLLDPRLPREWKWKSTVPPTRWCYKPDNGHRCRINSSTQTEREKTEREETERGERADSVSHLPAATPTREAARAHHRASADFRSRSSALPIALPRASKAAAASGSGRGGRGGEGEEEGNGGAALSSAGPGESARSAAETTASVTGPGP